MEIYNEFSSYSPPPRSHRILRWPELKNTVGYSRTNIYYLMQKGDFPQAIKLGGRAIGWLESEVNEWINDRVVRSRKGEE